ncbi:MAG: hypothetical protein AMJ90_02000 [candidate division Zixibacteria bacterium SM23_73_2]|nr:MAG: hypothetical protein AMJ90_02000 [candidate division Zixibacteria bacterium SM23_73_2]
MNCRKVRQYLPSYYDECLSVEVKKDIEKHLKECKSCAREAKAYFELSEMINCAKVLKPSPDFNRKLFAEIERYPNSKKIEELKPQTLFPRRWAIAVSAAVVILLSIVIFKPLGLFESEKGVSPQRDNFLTRINTESQQSEYPQDKPTTYVMDNLRLRELSPRGDRQPESGNLSQFVIEKVSSQYEWRRYQSHYVIPMVSSQAVAKRRGF